MDKNSLYEWLENYEEIKRKNNEKEKEMTMIEKSKILKGNTFNLDSEIERKLFLKKIDNMINNPETTEKDIENTL